MSKGKNTAHILLERIFVTRAELVLLSISGTLFIIYGWIMAVRDNDQVAQVEEYFRGDALQSVHDALSVVLSRVVSADIATMVLWAVVGGVVYAAVVTLKKLLSESKFWYRFFSDGYVHPYQVQNKRFIFSLLADDVLLVLSAFFLTLYTLLIVNTSIPFLYVEIRFRLAEGFSFIDVPYIVFYFLMFIFLVHLWVVIARLTRHRNLSSR